MNKKEQPIVCDLTVFSTDTRTQIASVVPDMFKAVQKVQELPDGYAFQFPNEPGMFMTLANFVEHERQCCPFYSFVLEAEPYGSPLWLRMKGGVEVKTFMQTAWTDLPAAVSKQLIQIGPDHDLDEVITQVAPVLADTMKRAEAFLKSNEDDEEKLENDNTK
jgi:hypothetical protein